MLRIIAPSASVLPPAPAQKSTTISPRLASVSSASSWLPSSCTSTSPRLKHSVRLSVGLPRARRPVGEYGVGSVRMPSSASVAWAASRLTSSVLTRRSSPADLDRLSISGQKSLPISFFSASASQSGRLWRRLSDWLFRLSSLAVAAHFCSASVVAARR